LIPLRIEPKMRSPIFVLAFLSIASAFTPSSRISTTVKTLSSSEKTNKQLQPSQPIDSALHLQLFKTEEKTDEAVKSKVKVNGSTDVIVNGSTESLEGDWIDESKKVELILLSVWMVSICAFILINNFTGPWPLAMKAVPERVFFLSHMIGGMLFGGGIILTTCIERLVAKSGNAPVLQFWFDKVPVLDGLIVVPALTVSMVSGTGLSIVRYGGLNVAPPHVGAIFWTLIAFLTWWAVTDLTTQGTALSAVNDMYDKFEEGEGNLETPKVVVDRHVSNVVSCFFVVLLYSMMVLKPGTLFPFPWNA